jgi:hypothetical protein
MEGTTGDEQGRRAGVNEALFREVNEQIRSLDDALGEDDGGTIAVICECADADCTERLLLLVSEYERVRDDALLYVVARGHELPGVEQVVERRDSWEVVRKVGVASEIAEETDPRS